MEGQTIQSRLPRFSAKKQNVDNLARSFRILMAEGNVNGALRLLSENKSGVLQLNEGTKALLKEKHPTAEPLHEDLLMNGEIRPVQAVIFDEIDAELIRSMALKTKGAAGPSNLDAISWRRILCSRDFDSEGLDLCRAIAEFTKSMCRSKVLDLGSLEAYLSCSLIPLDKNPGLRPIGIGEVLRRIVGKSITNVLKKDLTDSVDGVQMCVGHQGGVEAAVHAMVDIFAEDSNHGLIQVDANNAFNSINRKVLLNNVFHICPEIAIYTYNCYSMPARLFVTGGGEIKSEEGTTQGDPIAMPIYAIGLDPLLKNLKTCIGVSQSGFADDLSGAGTLVNLKSWWERIVMLGPKIGYYAKASKSWLIVKPHHLEETNDMFKDSGLNITTQGCRHLGAVIGSNEFKNEYVSERVAEWVTELSKLSVIAMVEPHAAYAAYIHGFKHKYNYLMRTIPNISDFLDPLDKAVDDFIVSLFQGREFSIVERQIFSLPVRLGGLAIEVPSNLAEFQYANSRLVTRQLVAQIKSQSSDNTIDQQVLRTDKQHLVREKNERLKAFVEDLVLRLSENQKKLREINSEIGASSWLTALPIVAQGFHLSKQEFVDALTIRYGFPLKRVPSKCACGASFSIEHALHCQTGGYISMRHNNLRDTFANMMRDVVRDVNVEPILTPLTGEKFTRKSTTTDQQARADISGKGFWSPGVTTFVDVTILNPLAPSYRHKSTTSLLRNAKNEKKNKDA